MNIGNALKRGFDEGLAVVKKYALPLAVGTAVVAIFSNIIKKR